MDGSSERRLRVHVVRQGCRVGQSDADAALAACGADAAATPGVDAVLVSTCAVTADAESAAFQAVRRAAREHPGIPVLVCGCLGALRRDALAGIEGVAAVLGPGEVGDAASALARAGAASGGAPREGRGASVLGERARPVLKVQDGCDRRCAYCVVPLARGASRSMPFAEAIRRTAELGRVADEVVLAGVHLGMYGADPGLAADGAAPGEPATRDLAALVSTIAERRLVRRLRLSSVDPLEFPVGVLGGAAAEVLCPAFHLPIQSGSDRVLRAMHRPYSAGQVASTVEDIAARARGAWISADVMTGFPGEGEDDHRQTVALVRSLPLAALHVFCFSPRPGTAAASLPGRVSPDVARERAAELRAISDAAWRGAVESLVGREVEAVVERSGAGEARGTTREGVLARWRAGASPASARAPERGRAVRLRALSREGDALRCEPA